MAESRLGPGSFMSIGLVAMMLSLAFYVGSKDGKTDARLEKHDEKFVAHETRFLRMEVALNDERTRLADKLDKMSQDLATIKAEIKSLSTSGARR